MSVCNPSPTPQLPSPLSYPQETAELLSLTTAKKVLSRTVYIWIHRVYTLLCLAFPLGMTMLRFIHNVAHSKGSFLFNAKQHPPSDG